MTKCLRFTHNLVITTHVNEYLTGAVYRVSRMQAFSVSQGNAASYYVPM